MSTSIGRTTAAPPVLVAFDGSSNSQAALTWAAHEARSRRTSLRIVHACPAQAEWDPAVLAHLAPEQLWFHEQGLRVLGSAVELASSIVPDLEVDVMLRPGSPARVIRAESRRASLTVLGHGPTGPRSLTAGVIARCGSPVSLLGTHHDSVQWTPPNRGLAVLQPGQDAATVMSVLDVALTLARRRAWPLTVMADWSHVWAAGMARALLLTRGHQAGQVDVETSSLPDPGCELPASCLSLAMVVLAPVRRRPAPDAAFDRMLLSSATSATFVSHRRRITGGVRRGSR